MGRPRPESTARRSRKRSYSEMLKRDSSLNSAGLWGSSAASIPAAAVEAPLAAAAVSRRTTDRAPMMELKSQGKANDARTSDDNIRGQDRSHVLV